MPYFRANVWEGKDISLADGSTWHLTKKVTESANYMTANEARESRLTPSIKGVFSCHNRQNRAQTGQMIIELQFPHQGSETDDADVRAAQATRNLNPGLKERLDALRRLTAASSQNTPILLAEEVGSQDSDSKHVPGGWIVYQVLTEVSGTVLGAGTMRSENGYRYQDGEYWKKSGRVREQIRRQYEDAYKLAYHEARVGLPAGLDCLRWDDSKRRLYINGRFKPFGPPYIWKGCPWNPRGFRRAGLAKVPMQDPTENESDVTSEELKNAGWKF